MRHAEGKPSGLVRSPSPTLKLFNQGVGGWGAAPLARSTPTLPTRAQRDVGKDTPKKHNSYFIYSFLTLFKACFQSFASL
ncbi:MAG: hypothetical protein NZ455_08730 [Bacteroidia bacterium]|nr:hypothetical protein [Bacteroidia bacterium]